jgi:tetratricopeptide (TPR) repeat protein
MQKYLLLCGILAQFHAAAQTSVEPSRCLEFNEMAMRGALSTRLDEADAAVSAAMSQKKDICAGVVSGNVAVLLSLHGRIRDSEGWAARSLKLLRNKLDPHDPMLFRPLYALANASLNQGKFREAEQAFEQMLQVRLERPEQRAQVHLISGALRHMQGKLKEAEFEYLMAYEDWKQLGKGADADTATLLNYLGVLYLSEKRLQEASQVLDRALAIVADSADVLPYDRIELLNARAFAHEKRGEWPQSQEKLSLALATADRARLSESAVLRPILSRYAIALRKTHRKDEARAIERRLSALPRNPQDDAVVDVHQLSPALGLPQH